MFMIETEDEIGNAVQVVFNIGARLLDLMPLAEDLRTILIDQNREYRARGVDRYGVPFTELSDWTIRKRVRQGRLGLG